VFTNSARPSPTARGASAGHDNNDNLLLSAMRQNRERALADARLVPLASPEAVPTLRLEPEPVVRADISTLAVVEEPAFDICGYDWNCPEAERIVWCESRFDPMAISWTGESFGLFQLNQVHAYRWPTFWSEWMIPEVNTAWAYELYLEQGWGIWECR